MNMELRLQLDDKDLNAARTYAGLSDPAALVQHVLREYVQLKARMELLRLAGSGGGCTPESGCLPPVRRPPDFRSEPRDLGPND